MFVPVSPPYASAIRESSALRFQCARVRRGLRAGRYSWKKQTSLEVSLRIQNDAAESSNEDGVPWRRRLAGDFPLSTIRKNAGETPAPRKPALLLELDKLQFADRFHREKCRLSARFPSGSPEFGLRPCVDGMSPHDMKRWNRFGCAFRGVPQNTAEVASFRHAPLGKFFRAAAFSSAGLDRFPQQCVHVAGYAIGFSHDDGSICL